jgi:peroxiredoxin
MAQNYGKYKAAGAEVIAISSDPLDKNRQVVEQLKLPFPVLSDLGHKVIDSYDILDPGGKISRASVFILDRGGVVRWVYLADDYKIRPIDDQLLSELNKIK